MVSKTKAEEKVNYLKYISIVVIVYLIAAGLIYWMSNSIGEKVSAVQEQRTHLSALDNRDKSYQQLQLDYKEIENQYQQVLQALPGQDNFVSFIVSLEKEAKNSQVDLIINFPAEPEIENGKLTFQLEVSGKLSNVIKYLKQLKDKPYYLEVSSVNLITADSRNQVSGEITIKIGIDETFNPSQISN